MGLSVPVAVIGMARKCSTLFILAYPYQGRQESGKFKIGVATEGLYRKKQ
jgi:hypothetical protein